MHFSSCYFRPSRKGSFSKWRRRQRSLCTAAPPLKKIGIFLRGGAAVHRLRRVLQLCRAVPSNPTDLKTSQAKYVMTRFNFKGRHEKLAIAGLLLRVRRHSTHHKRTPLQKPIILSSLFSSGSFVLLSSIIARQLSLPIHQVRAHCGTRSPKCVRLCYFTLLFCRGRQRNVQSYNARQEPITRSFHLPYWAPS